MQVDKNHDADPRSAGSDPGDSGNAPQPSSKLQDKLQKFAKWQIDPSSIEFPEDFPEFRGGYATVSQALLVTTSGVKRSVDDLVHTGGQNEPEGGSIGRKTVAVKKLKIENAKDNERVLGLALREAGFLTELSHENVIELDGLVEDLSKNRINDVARGVEYLHNRDPPIYHGDLKSVNVLVNSQCRAVITDFGSARRLAKNGSAVQPDKTENGPQPALLLETKICEATNTITLTGNKYTLRWAAPELLMDDGLGLWSDIWALGWIFFEVMTNDIPFQNVQKDSMVIVHVIQGNLPSVADHTRMALIRALYSLMTTCWSIDPTKRPTAEDCRKSISCIPMITPDPRRASNTSVSRAPSLELLLRLGEMHVDQNDHINASKYFTEALGVCTDTADNARKAEALFGLARVHQGQNKYSKAATLYSAATQLWTDAGDRKGKAKGLLGVANMYRLQDRYSEAATLFSEVAQLLTEAGEEGSRANILWGLGDVHRLQGHYSEAVPLFSEVARICTDLGDRRGRAYALWGLADVERLLKHYSQAAQLFSEALQIYTDVGDKEGVATTLAHTAILQRDQDQHRDAIRLLEQAAGIFEEMGNIQSAADCVNCAASVRRIMTRRQF